MRSALGKGLDALISGDAATQTSPASGQTPATSILSVDLIRPSPKQPRQVFDEEALADLAASIQQKGILQPIVVSPLQVGIYEIIAGERRFRAAQRAGLKEVPVVIREASEVERFEMSLIENLQREDLNPMDLAHGFRRLQEEYQMTQEQIAQVVGKARSVVANTIRLLGLPAEIQEAIQEGKITGGHAKALLGIEDPVAQKALFEQILSGDLTVRHVEGAARDHKEGKTPEHLRAAGYESRPPEVKALEDELQQALKRKVEIHANPKTHKGTVKLEFYSLDDFDQLTAQLKRAAQNQ